MSATNTTPIINLPLFIGTDKPAWLVDWNGAMNKIDNSIAALQTAEGGTASALAALSQSVTALSGTVEQHTTAIQTVTTATTTNTGSINTITSLIGNGLPTTDDKTIIGAINELKDDVDALAPSGDLEADSVVYDNQTSGLQATNVQAAIDELAQGGAINIVASETKIGKFLNKDLYRKVISVDNPTHGGVLDATLTISYIDDLVNIYGYGKASTRTYPVTFANVPQNAPSGTTTISASLGANGLISAIQGDTLTKMVVVAEYTKA